MPCDYHSLPAHSWGLLKNDAARLPFEGKHANTATGSAQHDKENGQF